MRSISDQLTQTRRAIRVCLLLAGVFVLIGIAELEPTPDRVFGGLGGRLRELLFTQFGPAGLCALWWAQAAALLLFARSLWRHADRVPGDRWYRR